MQRPCRVQRKLLLPCTPAQLWPFIADTDRVDRVVGLPPAHFTRTRRPEGGELVVGEYRFRNRVLARWIEHPFEWERPARYAILREYECGPLTRYYGTVELQPAPGGASLHIASEMTPRSALFATLVRCAVAPITLRRACRQYQAIATFLAGRSATPFPALVQARSPADEARLATLVARLLAEGAPPGPAHQLQHLLREAADEDVVGLRPLVMAEQWGTEPAQTLDTFLRATVVGLLDLQWEMLCPGCRGVKASASRLQALQANGYCPACNLHLVADRDEVIEARFYPAPAVRPAAIGAYCVGSPTKTPHRQAQMVLAPGGARTWALTLPAGRYRLTSPQSRGTVLLQVGTGDEMQTTAASSAPLTVRLEAAAITASSTQLPAGHTIIHVANASAVAMTVALDDIEWATAATTPGRLMTLPAFRTLFSDEALAPGVELAIGRVALLFTDLAGSTALYEQAGDARAFRLVSEHFTLLQHAIEGHGGALIKTIGDAVMAAFPDGRSALMAGLALQRALQTLDTGGLADPAHLLKVGIHAGPCYAVTLNDRLDYFGTTVNLAARAQHAARGGEIVATAPVFAEGEGEILDAGLPVEPFELTLKGLSAPVRLYRLDCRSLAPPPTTVASVS